MFKKYFLSSLILAILNFTGYSYLEVISKEDVTEGKAEINLSRELYMTTKDFTRYYFLPYTYEITNDTLNGNCAIESPSSITPFQGYIAVADIISFEQRKVDTGATIGIIAGIILVGIIVFSAMLGSAFADSLDPD